MLSAAHSALIVEEELVPAASWMTRHGATHLWNPDALELKVTFTKSDPDRRFFLLGYFDEYRALPPRFSFTDMSWGNPLAPSNYPRVRGRTRSALCIMHEGHSVICAPFNRLAYSELRGPHGEWGGPGAWLQVAGEVVSAAHLADMLSGLQVEIDACDGTLGDP